MLRDIPCEWPIMSSRWSLLMTRPRPAYWSIELKLASYWLITRPSSTMSSPRTGILSMNRFEREEGNSEPLLLLALFNQSTPSWGWGGVVVVVAHVIIVSAPVQRIRLWGFSVLFRTCGLLGQGTRTWTWAWQKSIQFRFWLHTIKVKYANKYPSLSTGESRDLTVFDFSPIIFHSMVTIFNLKFLPCCFCFKLVIYLFVMQRGFLLCFMSNMAANKTIYSLEPSR